MVRYRSLGEGIEEKVDETKGVSVADFEFKIVKQTKQGLSSNVRLKDRSSYRTIYYSREHLLVVVLYCQGNTHDWK